MLFNSIQYLGFLALVLGVYYAIPGHCRKYLLLACSYCFYMLFDWRFGGLLVFQTLLCFYLGKAMERYPSAKKKKAAILAGAIFSFGILGIFKYFNFFNGAFSDLFAALGLNYVIPHLNIMLPVGISFYTFQSFGYLIDVYRKEIAAEHDLCIFMLFVAFFPQLAAGPIGRAPELIPQLKEEHRFSPSGFESGISVMLWGAFKKVVVADRLAAYVNGIYFSPVTASSPSLLLAAIFFSIQIYCDFSGYSDIAIGSARLFGIELRKNFTFPYFATGISEFWKRWHISLTSWFRDYLYIPLGGNRCSKFRHAVNIMVVFLISGLWHGANWTFIIWGGIHGVMQLVELKLRGRKSKPYTNFGARAAAAIFTFSIITVAWVFFRAPTLGQAREILFGIVHWHGRLDLGGSQLIFMFNLLMLGVFSVVETFKYLRHEKFISSPALRGCGYAAVLLLICLFGQTSDSFIYLQF